MKKIISLLLMLTFIISYIPVFAGEYEYPYNLDDMAGLLKAVGIIDETYGSYEDNITREEFVTLIAKATGIDPHMPDNNPLPFTDIEESNEYIKYIKLAKDRKLINGYSDGTFKPKENITLTEGIVCAINLTGHNVMVNYYGGYPTGYLKFAKDNNITKNLANYGDGNLTKGAAVILLYNTLKAETFKANSYSNDGLGYESIKGETVLYDNFGITLLEGIVDGIDITSLRGGKDIPPYKVSIDGKILRRAETNANDYLGYNVEAYYKEINGQDSLIYICEKQGRNNEEIIDISDISDIKNYTIYKETDEGKTKKYSYASYSVILYNGTSTTYDFNMEILKDEDGKTLDGTVKLLDNDGDKTPDVIFVDAYLEYIVGKIDYDNGTVCDYFDPYKKLVLDTSIDEPYTLLYNSNGEEISFRKLKPYDSIIVYKSKDDASQQYHKGYVSDKVVSGVVEFKLEEDGKHYYTISGERYEITDTLFSNKEAVIGREINLTLNVKGKGVYFKYTGEDALKWGMLIKYKISDSYEEEFFVKFMTENGILLTYKLAPKVKIDGTRYDLYKDMTIIEAHLKEAGKENRYDVATSDTDNDMITQMVKYSVNYDGDVNYIDTVLHYYNKSLTPSSELTRRTTSDGDNEVYIVKILDEVTNRGYYSSTFSTLDGKVVVSSDTKVFIHPSIGLYDENIFSIKDKKYISSAYRMKIKAYYDRADSIECKIFMKEDNNYDISMDTSGLLFSTVMKITDTVNADGESRKKLYLFNNNSEISVLSKEGIMDTSNTKAIKDLKEGDIIYYTVSSATNELNAFQLRYDITKKEIISANEGKNGHYFKNAYVYDICDDGIIFVESDKDICDGKNDETDIAELEALYNKGEYRVLPLPKLPMTVYDSSKRQYLRVNSGDMNLLNSYNTMGKEASKILIHFYSNAYYIYKDVFLIK